MKREIREKECKDKLMELYMKNLDTACRIIDFIIPVIWKFDGKVYNAKFDNALKQFFQEREEFEQIYPVIDFTTSKVSIELVFYHRSIRYNDSWKGLPSGYDKISIAYKWCESKSSSYNPDKKKDVENGFYSESFSMLNKKKDDYYFYDENYNMRIKSGRIVDYLLEKQKDLREEIESLKENMKKVIAWNNEVEELKEKLEKLNDSIPYTIRQFYNIESYGRFQ